jgi:hypothetical protein
VPAANPDRAVTTIELTPEVKSAALTRAKREGLTLRAVVSAALDAYGKGQRSVTFPRPRIDLPAVAPVDGP